MYPILGSRKNNAGLPTGWPKYESISSRRFSWSHVRVLLSTPRYYRAGFGLMLLSGIYVFLTRVTVPWVDSGITRGLVDRSLLLTIVDTLLLGKAFSNASPLAVGIFPSLLLIRGTTLVGTRRAEFRWNLANPKLHVLAGTLSGMVILWWYLADAARVNAAWQWIAFWLMLYLGALLVMSLDLRLARDYDIDILFVNVLIALALQTNSLVHGAGGALWWVAIGAASWIGAILAIIITLIRHESVHIVNIRKWRTSEGKLNVPWSRLFMQLFYIFALLLISVPVLFVVSFFVGEPWTIAGEHWQANLIIALIAVAISLVMAESQTLSILAGGYSVQATANHLRNTHWIIKTKRQEAPAGTKSQKYVPVGTKTQEYLSQVASRAHRKHYLAYGFWAAVMCGLGITADLIGLPAPQVLGPIGTLLVATVLANVVLTAVERLKVFLESVNYAAFWTQPEKIRALELEMIRIPPDELFEYLLERFPEEKRGELRKLWKNKRDPKAFVQLIREAFKGQPKDNTHQSIGLSLVTITLKVLGAAVLSIFVATVLVPMIQLLRGGPVTVDDRVDLLLFSVATFFGVASWRRVHHDLRHLFDLVKSRLEQRGRVKAVILDSEEQLEWYLKRRNERVKIERKTEPTEVLLSQEVHSSAQAAVPGVPSISIEHGLALQYSNPSGSDGGLAAISALLERAGLDTTVSQLRDVMQRQESSFETISPLALQALTEQLGCRMIVRVNGSPELLARCILGNILVVVIQGASIQHERVVAVPNVLLSPYDQITKSGPQHWFALLSLDDWAAKRASQRWAPMYSVVYYCKIGEFISFKITNPINFKRRELRRAISAEVFDKTWRQTRRAYALVFHPDQEAKIQALLGEQLDDDHMHRGAIQQAEQEIASEEDVYSYFQKGCSLSALNQYKNAKRAFDKAIALEAPIALSIYWPEIFETYFKTGAYSDLMTYAERLLELDELAEFAHLYKAKVHAARGQVAEARRHFEQALQANRFNQDAKTALK